MYKPNRIFSNEEGSGLVLALMVLVVLAALGSTLGMVTINSHRLADHTQDTNSAYYIAEAGANMAYEEFKAEILSAYQLSSSEVEMHNKIIGGPGKKTSIDGIIYAGAVFQNIGIDQPTAKIEMKIPNDIENEYIIKSTGTINGKKRVVEKNVVVTWVPKSSNDNLIEIPDDVAGIVQNQIDLRFGPIVGKLLLDKNGTVKIHSGSGWSGGEKIDRDKVVNFDSLNKGINKIILESNEYNSLNVSFDQSAEVSLKTNYRLNEMHIRGPHNFNIGDKDIIIVVNNLQTTWGNSKVVGSGTLTIIVRGNISFGSAPFNIGDHNGNLRIIYYPNNNQDLLINNNAHIGGQIIAPKSKVTLGGSAHLYGTIVSKNFELLNHGYLTYKKYNFGSGDDISSSLSTEDLISTKPATEN